MQIRNLFKTVIEKFSNIRSPENRVMFIVMILGLFIVAGCTPGDQQYSAETPANFWHGVWHGVIAWVMLIASLFSDEYKIYAQFNNGTWYNLGYLIGISIFAGGNKGARYMRKRGKKWECDSDTEEQMEKYFKKFKKWADEKKDPEWEEITQKIEKKIKKMVKEWADKE